MATATATATAGLQEKYNDYQHTLQEISTKIQELRMDAEEHRAVQQTLQRTDGERRCYRMVGGALVEETVKQTLPVLTGKLDNIDTAVQRLSTELVKLKDEFECWQKDNQIKVIKQ